MNGRGARNKEELWLARQLTTRQLLQTVVLSLHPVAMAACLPSRKKDRRISKATYPSRPSSLTWRACRPSGSCPSAAAGCTGCCRCLKTRLREGAGSSLGSPSLSRPKPSLLLLPTDGCETSLNNNTVKNLTSTHQRRRGRLSLAAMSSLSKGSATQNGND